MKVYLAGPINGCTDDECKLWREMAKSVLSDCLDPMDRDYRGIEDANIAAIVEGDKEDILKADAVLVLYERPSVGTSMEIIFAWENAKHVVIVNKGSANLSPWLSYHSHQIFGSLEMALQYLLARS